MATNKSVEWEPDSLEKKAENRQYSNNNNKKVWVEEKWNVSYLNHNKEDKSFYGQTGK